MHKIKRIWVAAGCMHLAAFGAAINGTVINDQGLAVAGALVQYHRIRGGVLASNGRLVQGQAVSGSVQADALGTFAVKNLPSGPYFLCARGVTSTQLASCDWSQSLPIVSLNSDQASGSTQLVVREGTTVHIAVHDPNGRAASSPRLHISVLGQNGEGSLATLSAWQPGLLVFDALVLGGSPVHLFLDTALPLVDAEGVSVRSGMPSSRAFQIPAQAQATIDLTIM